jgi:hypothetical protein
MTVTSVMLVRLLQSWCLLIGHRGGTSGFLTLQREELLPNSALMASLFETAVQGQKLSFTVTRAIDKVVVGQTFGLNFR